MAAAEQAISDAQMVASARNDPNWFVRRMLAGRPWSMQEKILRSVWENARTSVRSCNGAGKTRLAAWVSLAFLFCWPGSKVATTAPTMRQVRHVLWREIRKIHRDAPGQLGGVLLKERLDIDEDWFAFGFTSSGTGSDASGLHSETGHVLLVFDEAAGVDAEVYHELEGALTGRTSRVLEIGNPTDPLSQFCENQKLPGTATFHIPAWETPNFTGEVELPGLITPEWVDDKRSRWGEGTPLWQARVEGEFPEARTDSLIPIPWLDRARDVNFVKGGRPIGGFDVAEMGEDWNVYGCRWGKVFRVMDAWQKHKPNESAGRAVKNMRETLSELVCVDGVGVGAGPANTVEDTVGPEHVIVTKGSRSAIDEIQFANRRSELFWRVREAFQNDEIDIDRRDENLYAELATITYTTRGGRIAVTPKEQLRKIRPGMGSTDRADALAMTYAADEVSEPSVAF